MHKRVTKRSELRGIWAGVISLALVVTGLVVPTASMAAEGDPEYLTVTKSVEPAELSPGQPFTYTIAVNCSERSCLDATLDDVLPAELAGYPVQNVSAQPGNASVPRQVTWTVDGVESSTAPEVITADTALHIDFTGPVTAPAGTGLQNGQTLTFTITLQVPDNLTPGTKVITNVAETAATNSAPDSDDATITVTTPSVIDVGVTKGWSPSPQSYNPGAPSTIDLAVTNASNGPVETLIIQEPAAAADGATALDPSNPFTITDFTGFGASTLPEGADQVQVDLYLQQEDGTWTWVPGPPSSTVELPADVDPALVGGIRLTYTGTAIAKDATGTVAIDVAQRESDRESGADLSTEQHTIDNVAQGTAAVTDRDPVSKTATANYEVNPVNVAAATTKSIEPGRIAAGDSAASRIVGTNTSDAGVDELRVADLDYFTADVTFGGFTAPPVWPTAATAGTLLYYPLAGGDPIEVALVNGEIPAAPGVAISGFEFVFTAPDGGIQSGASAVIDFTIQTSEAAVADGGAEIVTTNVATTTVTAENGLQASDDDDATLTLVDPAIAVTLEKSVRPSSAVSPGEPVVTELHSNLTTTSDYITATQIVVEDSFAGEGTFWDAFDFTSIATTQVPANTSLTIDVIDSAGNPHTLQVFPARILPHRISMSEDEVLAALPDGMTIDDVYGVRFTFDNPDGFPSDTTVTPYVVSEARDTLRVSGDATVPGDDQPVSYTNTATTTGSGETETGTPLEDTAEDTGEGTIETYANEGPIGIDKRWNQATVAAQSLQVRDTTLSWRVDPDYARVAISDPNNDSGTAFDGGIPGDPAGTVYDAFNLVRIDDIPADDEPFSNGWYIQYDNVDAVELFIGGAWVPAANPPAGGWIQNGGFVGYALTDDERRDATGFRIVLSPNTTARAASGDPFVDAIGDGVGSSSAVRTFDLTWQIRDQKRSDGSWVTGEEIYNAGDAGLVDNTVRIDGEPLTGGDVASDVDNHEILITDSDPAVDVRKSVTPTTPLNVPLPGADAETYPTATFTLEARNGSVAKASYIRVTDPPACTDTQDIAECQSAATAAGAAGDPFTADIDWLTATGQGNPFDRFDATKVTIGAAIPEQVDLAASVVWLLRYDEGGGGYATEQTTAAAVNAMTAEQLATVVGISTTFQSTDPATTGGTITPANVLTVVVDARVRPTIRSTGEEQRLTANQRVEVENRVFAQSYDPILSEGVATGDLADVTAVLTGGDLNVGATKQVSPDALTEPTRGAPVTVTLGANQGTDPVSTLAPAEVRVTDDTTTSPDFWNAFDVTGLGAITAPAGADQVVVSAYLPVDGELTWVDSAATAIGDAALPVAADQYGDIQGIRFAFSRVDGAFLSPAVPAPNWSTTAAFTAQLRDEYRDSGDPIPLEGTIDNTVTAVSDRRTGSTAEDTANAEIGLSPGTHQLAVHKTVNDGTSHFATAGDLVPWDLTFTNQGTGYLTVTELRDLLPPELVYLGDDPVYTPAPDGLLPVPEGFAQEGDELVFTWAEGSRMAPGETFSIRILLELQPGLLLGEQAINEMTVQTAEELSSCTNIDPGGAVTDAWDADPTTCGTTEYVTPTDGTSLFVVKGVRGERDGAINTTNPAHLCEQSLNATGGAYYRSPCAANSEIGGTDDWVLRAQNGGTRPISDMVLFDQLPVAGDQALISGASRGSVYRPQILDAIALAAPAGTTTVVEVTTSTGVCVGTWSNLADQEPCAQNGEEWVVADDATDWSTVSGLRVSLDFTTTAAGALQPGAFVDITYSSTNVVASEANPSGAPSAVPARDSFAWNQFGVKYRELGATGYLKISPSPVGVHLVFGSIAISKEITGDAAGYAPDEFLVDVVCTIDGTQLDLGDDAVLELNSANEHTRRIDGIPLGAACDIVEQGATGQFGETTRTGTPVTLVVDEQNSGTDVPAAQVATIGNDYAYSGLAVTKTIDTDATEGEFGPFDFTLSCTTATGTQVVFDGGATELEFTLEDGETFTAPENTIPARSTCVITEVDSADADGIVVVGDNVTDNGDGSATVLVGTETANVEFTNGYDSGILTVSKVVDGEGAALYGAGPFDFTAVCTYEGQTLLNEAFQLDANAQRTFGVYPTGTSCIVEETGAGGATRTAIDPADGTVVITDEADAVATVTATNTFDLTAIQVAKEITGPAAAYGADEYLVDVVCTVRGENVPLGDDAVVELNAANEFTHRIDGIPTGASCDVTEQGELGEYGETGRAGTPTVIDVTEVVAPDAEVPAAQIATVTNDYTFSGLSVTKRVDTEAEADFGPFDFTLSCTSATGIPVVFDGDATEVEFTLEADDTYTAPEDTIPANSTCLISEVDSAAADEIVIVGDGVTDNGDGTATVQVGTETASVEILNGFDAGILTVAKVVDGAGAELWGAGPFEFTAVCTYRDQTLLDETFVLDANAQRTFGTYPTGTECVVAETETAGATASVLSPADGVVTLTEGEGATVTATNTFALTAIEVTKTVTGDAADYASDEFRADVVCTVGGANVPLGADASVVLDEANDFTRRIDGIPTGATCEVTEQGVVGEFGETTRPAPVAIVTADAVVDADDEVPAEQTAELVNDYAFSGLSITKRVDADAEAGYGPFDFTLQCTSATGIPVTFGEDGAELTFSLEADGTFTAPANTIPARADCLITEVGATADGIVVTGDGVTDNGDGTASVQVGVEEAAVEFTNSFDAGVLTVSKVVDGAGASLYGTGDFTFTAVCTYDGQTLLDETFELAGGATRSFGPYPTNTECIVEETDAGGATSTVLDPSDGTVVLEADGTATVTATNTFDVAAITVTKERTGDLDADGARGSFTVLLECADGVTVPGGAERVLSAQGGYTTVFRDLPVGADCRISETDAGGAVKTTIVVTSADGTAVTSDGTSADVALDDDVDVEITNEFVAGLPATGLAMPIVLGILVLLLLGGGILVLLITRRRRALEA